MGTLYISQKHYIEAIDSLIRGGYWEDAAYIAERILTIDELKKVSDEIFVVTEDGSESHSFFSFLDFCQDLFVLFN